MTRQLTRFAVATAVAFCGSTALAQISDNFEADTSADYTVIDDSNGASGDGGADSTVDFAFDYIAAGIPLAPNSTAGDTGGLRFTANAMEEGAEGNTSTEEDHITAFHNLSQTGSYRLDVDMYMGVNTSAPGTTEMAHIGVAGASTDFTSIFTPVVVNGHFISITGEGGSGSDYRHAIPGTGAVGSGDPSYLNELNTTNAAVQTYLDIYPTSEFPGSPTNLWTTVTITNTPAGVTYWLDGNAIITTPSLASDGLVSLGLSDLFDSVGPHFVVYDNLSVTAIPEPSAALMCLAGLAGLARRTRVS